MTRQEIFNRIWTHLNQQKRPAINKEGGCVYRYKTKTRTLSCAIGCLIPDELYDPEMENDGVDNLFEQFPKVRKLLGARNADFLSRLQIAHDSYLHSAGIKKWRIAMKTIAENYKLKVPA